MVRHQLCFSRRAVRPLSHFADVSAWLAFTDGRQGLFREAATESQHLLEDAGWLRAADRPHSKQKSCFDRPRPHGSKRRIGSHLDAILDRSTLGRCHHIVRTDPDAVDVPDVDRGGRDGRIVSEEGNSGLG